MPRRDFLQLGLGGMLGLGLADVLRFRAEAAAKPSVAPALAKAAGKPVNR